MEQRMTQRISICPHCRDTYPDFDVAHVCSRGPYAPKLKAKMKNRIKELMPKPWTFPYPDRELYTKEQFEKFAELIVAAMLQTCEDHPAWTGRMIGEKIKEHFGVTE
jgi:hypothetical protein